MLVRYLLKYSIPVLIGLPSSAAVGGVDGFGADGGSGSGSGSSSGNSSGGGWEIGAVGEDSSLRYGPFDVLPYARLDYEYIDNAGRVSDRDEAESSNALLAETGVRMNTSYRDHTAELGMAISSGHYFESSENDYLNLALDLNTDLVATTRNRFRLGGFYRWQTEARGTGISIGAGGSLDDRNRYEVRGYNGDYRFGAPTARGGINLGGGHTETRYTNNRSSTNGFSFDEDEVHAGFEYRHSPASAYRVRVSETQTRYLDGDPLERDNDQQEIGLGIVWDPRGRSVFSGSVGYQRRDILPSNERVTSPYWNAAADWQLYQQTLIGVETGRTLEEAELAGDYSQTTSYGVRWGQLWVDRFRSTVRYGISQAVSEDVATGDESDTDTDYLEVEGRYAMRRWLDTGIRYRYETQDSDVAEGDYEVNSISLFVAASL